MDVNIKCVLVLIGTNKKYLVSFHFFLHYTFFRCPLKVFRFEISENDFYETMTVTDVNFYVTVAVTIGG